MGFRRGAVANRFVLASMIVFGIVARSGAQASERSYEGLRLMRLPGSKVAHVVSGDFAPPSGDSGPVGLDPVLRAAWDQCKDAFGGDASTAFGVPKILSVGGAAAPERVWWPQVHSGLELSGYGLKVTLDSVEAGAARVRQLKGSITHDLQAIEPAALSAAAARDLAKAHALLLSSSSWPADSLDGSCGTPTAKLMATRIDGRWRATYVCDVFDRNRMWTWRIHVDALSGEVRAAWPLACTGEGLYLYGTSAIPFKTGSGSGRVYASQADAVAADPSTRSLPQLGVASVPGVLYAQNGSLFGSAASVITPEALLLASGGGGSNTMAFEPSHSFKYEDALLPDADLFQQVNAYYWIGRARKEFWSYLDDDEPKPLDFPLPIVTNLVQPPESFNAFWCPTAPGCDFDPNFLEGFIVLGELQGAASPLLDFAIDPSVIVHEYVHAFVHDDGFTFGSPPGHLPPRAINEALADYFAADLLKDPAIGSAVAGQLDPAFVRDISQSTWFPVGLGDQLNQDEVLGPVGVPEEHHASLYFSAALWSLREELGPKKARDAIIGSIDAWPEGLADCGSCVELEPQVGPFGASNYEVYYRKFFNSAFVVLLDSLQETSPATAQRAMGALMRHGFLATDDDSAVFIPLPSSEWNDVKSIKFESELTQGASRHLFNLSVPAGKKFHLAIKAIKQSVPPVVDFTGPVVYDDALEIKPTSKGIVVKGHGPDEDLGGFYVYDVVIDSPVPASYSFVLKLTKD